MSRRQNRAPLGPCNLLTLAEAIAELGIRDVDARAWLEAQGLVHVVAGRRRVVAGDLAEAVRGAPPHEQEPRKSLQDLPMADID